MSVVWSIVSVTGLLLSSPVIDTLPDSALSGPVVGQSDHFSQDQLGCEFSLLCFGMVRFDCVLLLDGLLFVTPSLMLWNDNTELL